eukprot:CAMPEP_0197653310 /NCGR_PEP_ID=MMETSP1338-20131121/34980_1 /TAXON_ID=43686 ORGANISM="Pelagodinium beii, Strain RCC1491" /NCGR_SAMPLE_ID=MMETSP1338 /ASSEMBLY_ACC=CAM_ASM_000754 /LENGTH=74 /DNA_ID=CAMNT_0043228363 /DNA_START=15 /DNA_END=236 /DNA_ORIENTATION=+
MPARNVSMETVETLVSIVTMRARMGNLPFLANAMIAGEPLVQPSLRQAGKIAGPHQHSEALRSTALKRKSVTVT